MRHHGDRLRAVGAQRRRDIGRERRVATFVRRNELIVDPDMRAIVNGAKMQQYAAIAGLDVDVALVPAPYVKPEVTEPARLRFRRKRHFDRQRPFGDIARLVIASVVVEGESPRPVQRLPMVSLELRARITE